MKKKKNLYIVRKYIKANSALEAIKLDKKAPVNDVWIDDKQLETKEGASAIGFVDYRE